MKQVLADGNDLGVLILEAFNSFYFVSLNSLIECVVLFGQLLNDHQVLLVVFLEGVVGTLQLIVDVLQHLQLFFWVINCRFVLFPHHQRQFSALAWLWHFLVDIVFIHLFEQMGVCEPASRHNIKDHNDSDALLGKSELVLSAKVSDVIGQINSDSLQHLLLAIHQSELAGFALYHGFLVRIKRADSLE